MEKITEVAQSFKQNAIEQRKATRKAVKAEFQKLNSVIELESRNAQNTYKNAIKGLNHQHWILGTLSALPLLAVFLIGCGLTAWLCLGESYTMVKTYELDGYEGRWVKCRAQPKSMKSGAILCIVRE